MPPMIIPIVSSLLYSTKRRAVLEVIPPGLKNLWEEWDFRLTILISTIIQVILSILGNCRKYNDKSWIRILIWVAYTGVDSVTTFALGIVSQNLSDVLRDKCNAGVVHLDPNLELATVWAQFLLLHLGGPDSITAYALEDNELWLRQLLGLVTQTFGVAYVFFLGKDSRLSILSILIFIAGFIKYGERVWVLRTASNQIHKKSMVREDQKEPWIKYDVKREYGIKREVGHVVGLQMYPPEVQLLVDFSGFNKESISEEGMFVTAYGLLRLTKRFLVDGALSSKHRDMSQTVFRNLSMEDAFQVNEIQLGMMYDLLYTKAPLLYSRVGIGLRLFTFFLSCSSLVFFSLLDHKNKYSVIDLSITFLLLVVALVLEIYAILVLLSSDWFFVWLSKNQKKIATMKFLASFPPLKCPRWSNTMSQYTLLIFSRKKKPLLSCGRFLSIGTRKYHEWTTQVTKDLKELIFQFFEEKADELATTGKTPFTAVNIFTDQKIEEETEKDFEYLITLWSLVTEFLYRLDRAHIPQDVLPKYKAVKQVFRYMLYLLINHPSMISAEIGLMPFSFEDISGSSRWYLYNEDTSEPERYLKNIADALNSMDTKDEKNNLEIKVIEIVRKSRQESLKKRWEELGDICLEMLGYTARRSRGNEHARHLGSGGEFLTHVWLLMAHFGLTHHFRIARQGTDPIARLITV